ncbi:MAG: hypothetical protein K6T35_03725, partial [Meiothermus silvanus]|nr:hypothetical protein [Allomeiothermus silvanus]
MSDAKRSDLTRGILFTDEYQLTMAQMYFRLGLHETRGSAGQHDSAQRFHDWAARTVLRHADKAERAMQRAAHGEPLGGDYLHARYTTDGAEGLQDWPNFQLDGFGTWLWALGE